MSDYEAIKDQEQPEYEHTKVIDLPDGSDIVLTVLLSKVGGGTIGQSYDGRWEYWVFVHAIRVLRYHNDDLFTGTPKTHAEAAEILIDFLHAELGED